MVSLNKGVSNMITLIVQGKRIFDKISNDEVTVYAAQASFFIVISFFPFIMLLLNLIQFVPNVNKSDLLTVLINVMPDTGLVPTIAMALAATVVNKKVIPATNTMATTV